MPITKSFRVTVLASLSLFGGLATIALASNGNSLTIELVASAGPYRIGAESLLEFRLEIFRTELGRNGIGLKCLFCIGHNPVANRRRNWFSGFEWTWQTGLMGAEQRTCQGGRFCVGLTSLSAKRR